MPTQRAPRGGHLTRDRIAEVATELFLERGFDVVTVNEVAAAAGVSKVTVFAHFACKEDLLLDRGPEAQNLLRAAVRERAAGVTPVQAFRELALDLARRRHPLAGLGEGYAPFLHTVAASPALLARARELFADLEDMLTHELRCETPAVPRPGLLAALIMAAYRSVVADTARLVVSGRRPAYVATEHRKRLNAAFDAVEAAAAVL